MAKSDEINFLKNVGKDGQNHAFNKPFCDNACGMYFMDMGYLFSLLPPPPATLLDLGMGAGWTSVFFAKRGYVVTGQDIAEDMIALAKENMKRNNVEQMDFILGDFESLDIHEKFDYAVFYETLHHAEDQEKAIKCVYDALKPGGMCLTIEPGNGHARSPHSKKVTELYGTTERDMPPELIIKAARKAGFRTIKVFYRIVTPIEIVPVFSRKWIIETGKLVLKGTPWFSKTRSNIVMLIK